MTSPYCAPQLLTYWLGIPGGRWINFVLPDTGYGSTMDQGRIDHLLLTGAHSVQRQVKTRRSWSLPFSYSTPDLGDKVVSAAYGLLGAGPYWFVDPIWRNAQPAHIAACGALLQNSSGFIASGAVAFSSAVTPPAGAPLSGVQIWTAAVNGTLGIGQTAANVNDVNDGVPFIPATPTTWAMYLQGAAATTITVTAQCSNALGVSTGTVALGTWAVTTAMQRFSQTLAAASVPAGTAFISLTLKSSAATTINVAAIDTQYVTAAVSGVNATALPAWVLGLGIPRMLISGTQKADHGGRLHFRNHDLTLVEAG